MESERLHHEGWELRERFFSEEHMYRFVHSAAVARNMEQTLRVLPLMRQYHAGQTRKGITGRVPYIVHPLTMACHCFALGLADDEIIPTMLLHDVIEDCGVGLEELPVSDTVREAIDKLTFEVREGETWEEAKARYYAAMTGNKTATIVKAFDRCNNISTMALGFSKKKMFQYIDETEKYVLPLLNQIKHQYPECYNAAYLIKYHLLSVLETVKSLLNND